MKLLEQFLMLCGMIGEIVATIIKGILNAVMGFIFH